MPQIHCGNVGHCGLLHLCNLRVKYGFCKHERRYAAPLRLGGPGPRMANSSASYQCDRYQVVKLCNPKPLGMPRCALDEIPNPPYIPGRQPYLRLTAALLAILNDGESMAASNLTPSESTLHVVGGVTASWTLRGPLSVCPIPLPG